MEIQIPQKSHFNAQELCQITQIKPYVLRFWESEFVQVAPVTDSTGQKIYTHRDVETIMQIKVLLFDEKLNIEEAKARMSKGEVAETAEMPAALSYRMTDEEFKKLAQAKANLKKIIQLASPLRS